MIPIRDRNPSGSRPLIVIGLIVANVLVFLWEIQSGGPRALEEIFRSLGLQPIEVTAAVTGRRIQFTDGFLVRSREVSLAEAMLPLLTHMFLHGGWLHLIGNMWFLWIFGDNVEDRLGKGRFVLFYLLCGLGAAVAQILVDPESSTPMVGASGAASGILGAYLVAFPRARILTLFPIGFLLTTIEIRAFYFILFWFVFQNLIPGLGSLGARSGIAFWAHIGGFAVGVGLFMALSPSRRRRTIFLGPG